MSTATITLDRVCVGYERQPALKQVSGRFLPGSLTAVVGPNGAGKSTLIKALSGALKVRSGRIDRGGLSTRDFAYLPQASEVDRTFPISVADVVAMGAWRQLGAFRGLCQGQAARIRAALETVGLDGFERRAIGALSVGQFQRTLFARLLVQDSPVILLDEPFAAVDARTTRDLLNLVRDWKAEGRTVIAVLHDFDQVHEYFPQALLLAGECVAWGATADTLTATNLERARGQADPQGAAILPRRLQA